MDNGAVNDHALARWLTIIFFKLLTLEVVARILKPPGRIVFVSPNICIKSTAFTTPDEAAAMQFVAKNTAVPVPKIYCAFEHKKRVYIVMERFKGQTLSKGWFK